MKKYLTFLRTVLIIWMPKCIQERIEDTQMAWERLKMARYNARVKARDPFKDVFVPYNRVDQTIPEPTFEVTTTAKKKAAKKKVARKKAKTKITKDQASKALEQIGKDIVNDILNKPPIPPEIPEGKIGVLQVEKPKRIRRSKAQIEADRQVKEQQNV